MESLQRLDDGASNPDCMPPYACGLAPEGEPMRSRTPCVVCSVLPLRESIGRATCAPTPTPLEARVSVGLSSCMARPLLGHTRYPKPRRRLSDRVDSFLTASTDGGWPPNVVLLGSLVNAAGERYNWQRAAHLWRRLTSEFGVVPNGLAYGAYAKAHLLSGRPTAAAMLAREATKSGLATPAIATLLVQAYMLMYHSSCSATASRRLSAALAAGKAHVKVGICHQGRLSPRPIRHRSLITLPRHRMPGIMGREVANSCVSCAPLRVIFEPQPRQPSCVRTLQLCREAR